MDRVRGGQVPSKSGPGPVPGLKISDPTGSSGRAGRKSKLRPVLFCPANFSVLAGGRTGQKSKSRPVL